LSDIQVINLYVTVKMKSERFDSLLEFLITKSIRLIHGILFKFKCYLVLYPDIDMKNVWNLGFIWGIHSISML